MLPGRAASLLKLRLSREVEQSRQNFRKAYACFHLLCTTLSIVESASLRSVQPAVLITLEVPPAAGSTHLDSFLRGSDRALNSALIATLSVSQGY